jgi:soluble cytochrome b562
MSSLQTVNDNRKRAAEIQPYIQQYINLVNSRLQSQRSKSKEGKKTADVEVDHYRHAITAFVERIESDMENPIKPIDSVPPAHEIVVSILEKLYNTPHQQQQQQVATTTEGSSIQVQESGLSEDTIEKGIDSSFPISLNPPSGPTMTIRPLGNPKRKRSKYKRWRGAK